MTVARLRALTGKPTKLHNIAKGLLLAATQVMDKQLDDAINILTTEPPPKAGSNYVRTHTYSRNWHRSDVRLTGAGLVGTINNPTLYAQWVGGNEAGNNQLPMHRATGWPLMAVALREGKIGNEAFASKIRKAIRGVIDDAI